MTKSTLCFAEQSKKIAIFVKSTQVQEFDINNYMYSIDDGINRDIGVTGYKTYEEAELACIKKLIELVKEKK